ncbi:MAG: zf-HC2 domain-containing protein [Dehalococcoidia bacterium]|nr:zf-HC2 domain-containing protein [Dehalococcoidia bacterium]MDW8120345.1 zf-HC2 domain-containing protein [Chloroflexota bacterium]
MWLWGRRRGAHPSPEMLSCFLDDQVSKGERLRIERHLEVCAECRRMVEDLRQVRQWLQTLPQEQPSSPIRIAPPAPHPAPRLAVPHLLVPSAVAMGLLLMVLVATDLSLGFQARQGTPLPPPAASATQPGQSVLILAPDIPKEAVPPPSPSPTPIGEALPKPTPRPLLAWGLVEGVVTGVLLLMLALARLVRRMA